jgi:hypothetical protein
MLRNNLSDPGTSVRFKLFLEPRALRDESAIDPRLPQLPVRVNPPFLGILTYCILARQNSHGSYS